MKCMHWLFCPECRVFAKPFVAAFPHEDGITCLARNPKLLNGLVSGLLQCMPSSIQNEPIFALR